MSQKNNYLLFCQDGPSWDGTGQPLGIPQSAAILRLGLEVCPEKTERVFFGFEVPHCGHSSPAISSAVTLIRCRISNWSPHCRHWYS